MNPYVGSTAAAGALLLAGLGLASAGQAHEPVEGHGGNHVEKVIVITDKEGGGRHVERRVDRHVERRGHAVRHGHHLAMAECAGERTEIAESTADNERTRIVVCDKGGLSAAQRVEKLEHALERIASNDHISAEHKEKVTTALREAIGRLRATP